MSDLLSVVRRLVVVCESGDAGTHVTVTAGRAVICDQEPPACAAQRLYEWLLDTAAEAGEIAAATRQAADDLL